MLRRITVLLLLALAACGRRDAARTAVSDSTAAPRIDPGTIAGTATLELWQLRGGVTLGEWKGAHPDESINGSDTSAVSTQLGDWCAAAQRTTQIGARILTRTAFFYPPDPDPALALRDSAVDLVKDCVLGLIWVRADIPDSGNAARVSDSLKQQLTEAYGAPVAGPVQFYGSAMWARTARFRKGELTALTGLRARTMSAGAASPAVFAFALLPLSGIGLDDGTHEVFAPTDTVALDSAAAIVHADTSLYRPLRALVNAPDSGASGRQGASRDLTQPLQRWLAGTAGLPLPRRAAALYIADRVLDRAMCAHALCEMAQAAARAPLEALGARFNRSELGGGYVYLHSWMDQARILDRDSPLGQRIFLFQMANGFDPSGTCAAGAEGFRRVISNGERYLERVPASPIAADVHYQVGDAYRDIVALARGAAGDYADSSRYGSEAGGAALKALEHYRAAMRAGPASATARAAWKRAWWLKAGLVPRDVRFYCIYD